MDTKYLSRKGNAWQVVVEVPKDKRPIVGKPRFKRSLGACTLTEANRRKLPIVAAFHAAIDKAVAANDPKAALRMLAAVNAREIATATGKWDQWEEVVNGHEFNMKDWLRSFVLEEERKLVEDRHGEEEARRFVKASLGEGTALKDLLEPWLLECTDTGQTKSQHRSTVGRYLEWAGEFATLQETDRLKAGEYVTHLLTASGLARRTIKRHLSSLSTYWQWLDSKGHACQNVWLGHKLGKKPKGRVRKGLTDEMLLKLLQGRYSTEKFAQVLWDLVRLGLLHGARLDELCALRKEDVANREDGYWIKIGDGKTDSAIREIPVHAKAVPIIERRLAEAKEWVFEGLTPGGPDKKRSWYISKAYGRFRNQAGVKGRFEDFHALRHTFMELMEGLEVAESTTKLVVGHKRESMTYGLYSKGQRVNLRTTIDRVDYGPKVMAAI